LVSNFEILIRLALACLLGGLIGMERERSRHPAGLRTHILVCIGATLVMLCNIFIFEKYKNVANIDPARLGAQVISGIGFLGAGTIIKEGLSIRGLTTAASLWVVGCLGIAIGLGFYSGAIVTTSFILIILMIFSKLGYFVYGKGGKTLIVLKSVNIEGQLDLINSKLNDFEMHSTDISVEPAEDNLIVLRIKVTLTKNISSIKLIEEFYKLNGIKYVQICD
jgi:putative Mg2+ transporter-C (MgtC) family protein